MHEKFAKRIADQIHLRKWRYGYKPPQLAKWLEDRFPQLTQEDSRQIKQYLPKK